MNNLATAINNKAESNTELMNAIDDNFYYMKASSESTYPYCRFQLINDSPSYTFNNDKALEDSLWQVDIFAKTATEAGDIAELIKETFDEALLDIQNYDHVHCGREMSNIIYEEDRDLYHYYVEYRIYTEEN